MRPGPVLTARGHAASRARTDLAEPDTWGGAVSAWRTVHGFTSLWSEGLLKVEEQHLPGLAGMTEAVAASVASLVLHAPSVR